jgi:flagellar protein FlaJ
MKGYVGWVEKYITYCGFKMEVEKFIRFVLILAIIMISFSIVIYFISGLVACLATLVILLISELFLHAVLVFVSNRRASIAEEMLPDVLRLISSNLRAGIIPERAFLMSARAEFGPLSEQIKEAGKALVVGEGIEKAFKIIPEKINSPVLRKTMNLIVEGVVKGGNLAPMLENLAEDIKSSLILRRDIKAHVNSYIMFIFMAIGIGSPILYAASTYLAETLIGLSEILPTQNLQTGMLSLSLSSVQLSPEFILGYTIALMLIAAIFGGLLIGLIQEGKEFAGVKYIPILIFLELGLFYFVKFKLLASFIIF